MKKHIPRGHPGRKSQQSLQMILGGGLLVLCLGFAIWDFVTAEPLPLVRLPVGYWTALESSTELGFRSIPAAETPVDLDRPIAFVDEEARAGLVEYLLGDVVFEPTDEELSGPFLELWFQGEEENLRVLMTADYSRASFAGPVVTHRYRVSGAEEMAGFLPLEESEAPPAGD